MKFLLSLVFPFLVLGGLGRPPSPETVRTEHVANRNLFSRQARTVASIARTEYLEPQIRQDATRKRLHIGPFSIPGKEEPRPPGSTGMDVDSFTISRMLPMICANCTVLSGKSDLTHEDGSRADIKDGIYQHHVAILDMSKRNIPFWLCPGQSSALGLVQGAGFVLSGNDEAPSMFTTPDGKFKSGYAISRDVQFVLSSDVVNYNPTNRSVFISLEVEYVNGGMLDGYTDASVSLFSVTGCGWPSYHPPPGAAKYNVTTPEPTVMPVDGYVINAKGHLHDGGVGLLLHLNDKLICDSRATYGGGDGTMDVNGKVWQTITEMSQCTEPVPFKKGDLLTMTSVYDTDLHPLRQTAHGDMSDEMGVYFISFAVQPGQDLTSPPAAQGSLGSAFGSLAGLLGMLGGASGHAHSGS